MVTRKEIGEDQRTSYTLEMNLYYMDSNNLVNKYFQTVLMYVCVIGNALFEIWCNDLITNICELQDIIAMALDETTFGLVDFWSCFVNSGEFLHYPIALKIALRR